jgi:hypothetical protein
MKTLSLLLILALTGCNKTVPAFDIGDNVIVNGKIDGVVVDVKNYTYDKRSGSTSDYQVMFEMGAAVWYDEELLKRRQ